MDSDPPVQTPLRAPPGRVRPSAHEHQVPDAARPDYLALFFVIFIAIVLGNLTSTVISAAYVAYQADQAVKELNRRAAEERAELAKLAQSEREHAVAAQQQSQEQARRARASGQFGKRLAQSCSDWQRADNQTHTNTTQEQMNKACSRYQSYLDTGVWKPDDWE
jgi:hypothetical protein